MSNVQLLSSALERLMDRRTLPLQKRVCRNLFGPVDHDELHREMKDKLREISERDQERWNFNFEVNSPLDGLYEWEEVSVDETPAFYQDSVHSGRTHVPSTPVKRRPVEEPLVPDTPRLSVMERLSAPESSAPCPTEVNQENRKDKLNSGKQAHRLVPGVKRKRTVPSDNTHITDFFVKRKKVVERKAADVSSCHQSTKSPIPLEQTPRKRIR
ncbi:cyclin-dependent kinase inhibitor 1C-like [Boleophthalmus pectinirostris]|uniref:cyclin-dependent kinase inhibitor 1C-like n=1 Tax=Boleophthalmus pectinirostris TaxID=150288 RepID=UPI000A1C2F85|nr:cyclin-dependent kinase inhibitor 1C-like [Boleophthalmus pectinirostris]